MFMFFVSHMCMCVYVLQERERGGGMLVTTDYCRDPLHISGSRMYFSNTQNIFSHYATGNTVAITELFL